jgi:hypothetical protein
MDKLGSNYGGWYVPTNMNLTENSVVYSGGGVKICHLIYYFNVNIIVQFRETIKKLRTFGFEV